MQRKFQKHDTGMSTQKQERECLTANWLQVPEECPLTVAQLIDDCLENPARERPSARQAYDIIKAALAPSQAPPSRQLVPFRPPCSHACAEAP